MVFWNLSLTLRIYSQSSSWSDLVKKELDCSTSLHKNFQWFPISYRMNSKFFLWPKAPYNNLSPHYLLQLISFYFPPVSLCPRTVAMLLYLEHARYIRAEALVFFLGCLTVFFFPLLKIFPVKNSLTLYFKWQSSSHISSIFCVLLFSMVLIYLLPRRNEAGLGVLILLLCVPSGWLRALLVWGSFEGLLYGVSIGDLRQ